MEGAKVLMAAPTTRHIPQMLPSFLEQLSSATYTKTYFLYRFWSTTFKQSEMSVVLLDTHNSISSIDMYKSAILNVLFKSIHMKQQNNLALYDALKTMIIETDHNSLNFDIEKSIVNVKFNKLAYFKMSNTSVSFISNVPVETEIPVTIAIDPQ
jgi:hypothetical protein